MPSNNYHILLILPRRGLFQLTVCQDCSHTWQCDNCSANLVAYSNYGEKLNLVCHHCQSTYQYPKICPKCKSNKILSKYSGIDDLDKLLSETLQTRPARLDKKSEIDPLPLDLAQIQNYHNQVNLKITTRNFTENIISQNLIQELQELQKLGNLKLTLSTRIFDPAVDYSKFTKIIYVKAEGLLASPDYLVQEEVYNQLFRVFLNSTKKQEIIFDTTSPNLKIFQNLSQISDPTTSYFDIEEEIDPKLNLGKMYLKILEQENRDRKKYKLPPFYNLVLVTSQEKQETKAYQKVKSIYDYFQKNLANYPSLIQIPPYKARLLKRKGYYSYHIQFKYPRNYSHFHSLKKELTSLSRDLRLQIRLNPRHIF